MPQTELRVIFLSEKLRNLMPIIECFLQKSCMLANTYALRLMETEFYILTHEKSTAETLLPLGLNLSLLFYWP